MRDHKAALLEEIRAFIAEQGMSETRFGLEAVNDSRFLRRLPNRDVTLRTVTKIQEYMRRQRARAAAE
jgi:hypothetical protein